MDTSLTIAQNGIHVADSRFGVIANNLANLTTEGFQSHLSQQNDLFTPGTGLAGVQRDFGTVGSVERTGVESNMMIGGKGFFVVQTELGLAYSRAGEFAPDSEGRLVTPAGHVLDPEISVPEESLGLRVLADGTVLSITPEGTSEELGAIEIARFLNPNGLTAIGENLFLASEASGDPLLGQPGETGFGTLLGGAVEGSNVQLTQELPRMLVAQRSQQYNLRAFQTADALIGRALDLFS